MKKTFVVVGLLWAGVCVASGQVTQPEWLGRIRKDHPRMFFNAETWPKLVERSKGPAAAAREALIRRCRKYPTDPVCTGTGQPVDREGLTVDSVHTGIPPINEFSRPFWF